MFEGAVFGSFFPYRRDYCGYGVVVYTGAAIHCAACGQDVKALGRSVSRGRITCCDDECMRKLA